MMNASEEEIEKLLAEMAAEPDFAGRLRHATGAFLGRPYVSNPLIGGPREPEVFTASLDGFDCVTYVETVLALARAGGPADFFEGLREMRYEGGEIDWRRRNHYMIEWARNNAAGGLLADLTEGDGTVEKERALATLKDLPPRVVRFRCYPKRALAGIAGRLRTGDLLLFVSTRRNLDVFHVGVVVEGEDGLMLRHATRSRGAVIEQPLREFLGENRMSGFILLRPLENRT